MERMICVDRGRDSREIEDDFSGPDHSLDIGLMEGRQVADTADNLLCNRDF